MNHKYTATQKQLVGNRLMLNNCITAAKCVNLISNLGLLSVSVIMVHFYLQFL